MNEALEKFATLDPRKAELVKLRYFVGMSFDEAATALGIGVVYVAEQTEPVRRRAALKVIKLGMDTKQVVARFETGAGDDGSSEHREGARCGNDLGSAGVPPAAW